MLNVAQPWMHLKSPRFNVSRKLFNASHSLQRQHFNFGSTLRGTSRRLRESICGDVGSRNSDSALYVDAGDGCLLSWVVTVTSAIFLFFSSVSVKLTKRLVLVTCHGYLNLTNFVKHYTQTLG